MRRVYTLYVTALTTAALLCASTVHATCTNGSVPGRLACNVGEAFATSPGRRVDEVASRTVGRGSGQALEHAGVATAATVRRPTTRQPADMVRAAQQAAPRAQRDAAERAGQAVAERTQRDAQASMQRAGQQQAKAVPQTTVSPSTSVATADPGPALASAQRLKHAHTATLPPRVQRELGGAIRSAEETAATAHTQHQRQLAHAHWHAQTQRSKAVVHERPRHTQHPAQAQRAPQHREAPHAPHTTRVEKRGAETTPATPRQAATLRLAEARLVDSQELAGRQVAQSPALHKAVPPGTTNRLRRQPGVATSNGQLPPVNDPHWLREHNTAFVPGQIAERLAGRHFRNFDALRSAVWRDIAHDPVLSRSFTPENLKVMRAGKAPSTGPAQQRGGRVKYELDHAHELQDGGEVYSLHNLRIKTPQAHVRKIARHFNRASGVH